jgi:hypothetical protein
MKYYIKDHGGEVDDARPVPNCGKYEYTELEEVEEAAEAAAEAYHTRSGWEASWPIVFTMVMDDGVEIDVIVERDYNPVFSGTKVKETV